LNSESLIQHIEYLVTQDETELALKCFDLVPAYYRDHKDKKLSSLKAEILSKMLMPVELSSDDRELPKSTEHSVNFLKSTARGQLLFTRLAEANESGVIPHIVDYGPGDFTFAIALNHLGLKFTYTPLSFHYRGVASLREILGEKIKPITYLSKVTWLVAYEIIEHLSDTSEISQVADRLPNRPEKIFLSTPKYTYGKGTQNWREEGIHHRRAYTPNEFAQCSFSMFPNYDFNYFDNEVMCLLGTLRAEVS
jgi:hypothetical protein